MFTNPHIILSVRGKIWKKETIESLNRETAVEIKTSSNHWTILRQISRYVIIFKKLKYDSAIMKECNCDNISVHILLYIILYVKIFRDWNIFSKKVDWIFTG